MLAPMRLVVRGRHRAHALLIAAFAALLSVLHPGAAAAQQPVAYRLSFPAPEHREMQVEVTFTGLPSGTLELRMSRSSPGRYAVHEFAKNVYDVRVTDAAGKALVVSQPNPSQWNVADHAGTVRVSYRVFGDRIDGTYLAIDSTHAHINMPAALMWARGLDARPVTVRFDPPAGSGWRVATQLMPGADPLTFTAPNLQYLMDSPSEFSAFAQRTFHVADEPGPLFTVAVHHDGSEADLDALTADLQKVVAEERRVYGEFPAFEGGGYTFIGDYLPWASGDAMEHRNSTFLSSALSIRGDRVDLVASAAHEFFHSWNVERIRPRSLEPFNFEDANMSGELWLAEGFTNYYEPLILSRAGLSALRDYLDNAAATINAVTLGPGRALRTAEEMSRMAPFVDAATAIDRTGFDNTFISYYTWGEAIGLGLDLTLRERSNGTITLDDFMRALWRRFGKPGGRLPGYVDNPYTIADARAVLGEVAGDAAFATDFFARYIQGHEVPNYAPLLARAGLILRPGSPGQGYLGELHLQNAAGKVRIVSAVPVGSPAYAAGMERDDVVVSFAGLAATDAGELQRAIRARRPGDAVPMVFERRGQRVSATVTVAADPRQEIVPAEEIGQVLTDAQLRFRAQWLGTAAR